MNFVPPSLPLLHSPHCGPCNIISLSETQFRVSKLLLKLTPVLTVIRDELTCVEMQWLQWFYQMGRGGGDAEATYGFWNSWWFGKFNIYIESVKRSSMVCVCFTLRTTQLTGLIYWFLLHSATCFGCILHPSSGRNAGTQKEWKQVRPVLINSGSKIAVKYLCLLFRKRNNQWH